MTRSILGLLVAFTMLAGDLTGKYVGSLILQGPDGEQDIQGAVVIQQTGEKLAVTAGPNLDQQIEATSVKLEGDVLTFQVQPPNPDDQPWSFQLKVEEKRLRGTVKATRGTETRTGKLDLAKQ